MDALTLFGVLAVTAMLLFYALEGPAESPHCTHFYLDPGWLGSVWSFRAASRSPHPYVNNVLS